MALLFSLAWILSTILSAEFLFQTTETDQLIEENERSQGAHRM